jgi:hypothetical protein
MSAVPYGNCQLSYPVPKLSFLQQYNVPKQRHITAIYCVNTPSVIAIILLEVLGEFGHFPEGRGEVIKAQREVGGQEEKMTRSNRTL